MSRVSSTVDKMFPVLFLVNASPPLFCRYSTSSGKFTIYQICTPERLLEGRKETEDVGGGGGEHPGRRGEERREGSRLATMETEVAKLISKWEKRAGGGDCGDSLKLPDMVGGDGGRRVSQEFTELRQRYVDCAEEGGGGRMSDGPRVTFATSFDNNFIQGRGAARKLNFARKSIVEKNGPPLTIPTVSGKRKWAVLGTEGGGKRFRGSI